MRGLSCASSRDTGMKKARTDAGLFRYVERFAGRLKPSLRAA
jgi:hypothetical protein